MFDLRLRDIWLVVKTAFNDFLEDRAPRLGAALAYYTIFSIAPLLVIAVAIGGFVFGEDAAAGRIRVELEGMLGPQGAGAVEDMIAHTSEQRGRGILASILGVGAMIFGATGAFAALKDALNTIWEVEPKPGQTLKLLVRDRLLSFAMVACIGFLLLVSLVVSAIVSSLNDWLESVLPIPGAVFQVVDWVVMLLLVTLLFAALLKFLPDAQIRWSEVWFGAIVTAVLFTIGKVLIGFYLGNAAVGSAYGAAGSVVIIMLWTYYSSQILLFGAELTQANAKLFGSEIQPAEYAQKVSAENRAQQGTGAKKTATA